MGSHYCGECVVRFRIDSPIRFTCMETFRKRLFLFGICKSLALWASQKSLLKKAHTMMPIFVANIASAIMWMYAFYPITSRGSLSFFVLWYLYSTIREKKRTYGSGIKSLDLRKYFNVRHCYGIPGWCSASHLIATGLIFKTSKASEKYFLCLMEFSYALQFVKGLTCIDFRFANSVRNSVRILLGNMCIFRNQNIFTFGHHLMQHLTPKANAVPVQLEINLSGSEGKRYIIGAVCTWMCIYTEVLPWKSEKNCLWM